MGIQITVCLLISQNMLIDPLMANAYLLAFFQPSRNLFWTPILPQFLFHLFPDLCRNTFCRRNLRTPFTGFFMRLPRTIASFTHVFGKFSTDCRFMHFKFFRYFRLTVPYSLQRRNLVSLF